MFGLFRLGYQASVGAYALMVGALGVGSAAGAIVTKRSLGPKAQAQLQDSIKAAIVDLGKSGQLAEFLATPPNDGQL